MNPFDYRFPGGFSGGATPDPIPNSEVKPTRADGTVSARIRKSRSLPGYYFSLALLKLLETIHHQRWRCMRRLVLGRIRPCSGFRRASIASA